jgi:hypothetical protein
MTQDNDKWAGGTGEGGGMQPQRLSRLITADGWPPIPSETEETQTLSASCLCPFLLFLLSSSPPPLPSPLRFNRPRETAGYPRDYGERSLLISRTPASKVNGKVSARPATRTRFLPWNFLSSSMPHAKMRRLLARGRGPRHFRTFLRQSW